VQAQPEDTILSQFTRSDSLFQLGDAFNSPSLVLLQFVHPNELSGDEDALKNGDTRQTPLDDLGDLADSFDYSTQKKQLILAKQLVEHGANVNAVSIRYSKTPLHNACYSGNVTNLDFIEYLLEEGADPNAQDDLGRTSFIYTMPGAPGAAKYLLSWPTTDVNITMRSGESFLNRVRSIITTFSDDVARPDNPERLQNQFLLEQWRDIEEMLVERGTVDTGITTIGWDTIMRDIAGYCASHSREPEQAISRICSMLSKFDYLYSTPDSNIMFQTLSQVSSLVSPEKAPYCQANKTELYPTFVE
jgi:hypothetical protein